MNRSLFLLPTALAAALALAACNPRENTAMNDAKRAGSDAATTVASAATDATITTKINAALAADDKLKAVKIDVDTSNGRVVLTGSAPDSGSRERATTLAKAVEGVVAVDNRLAIDGKS